jgi:hypothetical protein
MIKNGGGGKEREFIYIYIDKYFFFSPSFFFIIPLWGPFGLNYTPKGLYLFHVLSRREIILISLSSIERKESMKGKCKQQDGCSSFNLVFRGNEGGRKNR